MLWFEDWVEGGWQGSGVIGEKGWFALVIKHALWKTLHHRGYRKIASREGVMMIGSQGGKRVFTGGGEEGNLLKDVVGGKGRWKYFFWSERHDSFVTLLFQNHISLIGEQCETMRDTCQERPMNANKMIHTFQKVRMQCKCLFIGVFVKIVS